MVNSGSQLDILVAQLDGLINVTWNESAKYSSW